MPAFIIFFIMVVSLSTASAADFQKTWENAADKRITIFTPHGDIKLSGYDGKNIDISAVKKGTDGESVVIEDASVGNHINIFSRYPDPTRNSASVSFEIRVPKEIFYNEKPQGERVVYLQKFLGRAPDPPSDAPASAKTPKPSDASKPSKPSKPTPPPKKSLPTGDMQFPHAIYLKSNSGQIIISDVAGSIRVESRDILIENVEGTLYASSGSGDIRGTMKQTARHGIWRLSSSSGSISLRAPDDINAQVRIQSTNGQVKTDFPLETREMRYGGKYIEGKLGDGNQILDMRSVSGTITFSKTLPKTKSK